MYLYHNLNKANLKLYVLRQVFIIYKYYWQISLSDFLNSQISIFLSLHTYTYVVDINY